MRSGILQSNKMLNTIAKSKKPQQSNFRLHFTIMNVAWKYREPQRQQKLIDYVYSVINSLCSVSIIQVAAVIEDDIFDISVGAFNDEEAFYFLRKQPTITLSDTSRDHEYQPIVSRVFQRQQFHNKSYINRAEKKLALSVPAQSTVELTFTNQPRRDLRESKQLGGSIGKTREPSKEIGQKQPIKEQEKRDNHKSKQKDSKDKLINKIWAFGIPKQFSIADIKTSLAALNFKIAECRWRNKEHMQYLEIQLVDPILRSSVYYLGLEIEGYPYVVIPCIEENEISRELARYTVEIITRPSGDDEEKFIKCMADIGGVNVMIRTPIKQKDDFRYLIVFNNVSNAEKACRIANAQRKQYELKVGRINKFFTFTALLKDQFNR